MATSQGWMRPRGSKRIHYTLSQKTLCSRWIVSYQFYRLYDGKVAFDSRFISQQLGTKKMCTDCIKRYVQMQGNFGIPVEPPQPRPRFGG